MAREILIVEDDEKSRKIVTKRISKLGHDFEEAVDGIDAIEKMEQFGHFNLIILDIRMPRMDGLEFIKRIRSEHCESTIIIITEVDIKQIDGYDVYAVLQKPIDWKDFESKVESALYLVKNQEQIIIKMRALSRKLDEVFDLTTAHI